MKNSKILATMIILQILAQAVFAQEPQQAVQQIPQQEMQQEPQQAVQPVPQQAVQPVPQQAAQQEPQQEPQKPGIPTNTITIDFGPTIIGFAIGAIGSTIEDEFDISGFGFGVQYERQIFEPLSIVGRFAYLGIGTVYTTEGDDGSSEDAKADMNLSSFSLEVHPRLYPTGGSFFLDGMIGYANMSMDLKGYVYTEKDDIYGGTIKEKENKKFDISRSYFKYGAKLGWRADFGEPGGFIFEHSYGWYSASGSGKTMGKRLAGKFDEDPPKELNDAFSYFEDYLFIGGPRVTFAFGWKF